MFRYQKCKLYSILIDILKLRNKIFFKTFLMITLERVKRIYKYSNVFENIEKLFEMLRQRNKCSPKCGTGSYAN